MTEGKMKRLAALALMLALCAAALCGCRLELPGAAEGTAGRGGPGVLTVQMTAAVPSLDPQKTADRAAMEIIAQFTDGLVQPGADGQPTAALAERWEVSADGTVWTFYLREGAVWSGTGNPVTARDFVYAWQRAVDPDTACPYAYVFSEILRIENAAQICAGQADRSDLGVEARDDKTLVVRLEAPSDSFLTLLSLPVFYPVEELFLERCGGEYGTTPKTVQSNGAFVLMRYTPSAETVTLVKNEAYWDAGRVQLQQLQYRLMPDAQEALRAYQAGELDQIFLSGAQQETFSDEAGYASYEPGALWYLSVNTDGTPLRSVHLRTALSSAVDRETLLVHLGGAGRAAYFLVPDGLAAGPDGRDFRETAQDFSGGAVYDVAAAQRQMEQAKEELGTSAFTFTLKAAEDAQSQQTAAYLCEQLERALPDVTVQVVTVPEAQLAEDCGRGDFELALVRWSPACADPAACLRMWQSENAANAGRWSSSRYDALLESAACGEASADPQARWNALHQAEAVAMEEMAVIPLYEEDCVLLTRETVSGTAYDPAGIGRIFKDAVAM